MAYCKLVQVLNSLLSDVRTDIDNKLVLLANPPTGQQAVANLFGEDLVDESVWRRLVARLVSCAHDWGSIHDAVRDVMRSDQLNGPEAKYATGTIFGRATSHDDLASVLQENGHHGSRAAAREEIDYNKNTPADELRLAWGDHKLGTHVMWATFDVD